MPLFTLTIDLGKHGGETRASERGVILEALAVAAQAFSHTHTDDGEKFTGSIALSGHRVVGSFVYSPINPAIVHVDGGRTRVHRKNPERTV